MREVLIMLIHAFIFTLLPVHEANAIQFSLNFSIGYRVYFCSFLHDYMHAWARDLKFAGAIVQGLYHV